MEHTVTCQRPDIYKGVDHESCLNCGSIQVDKVTTTGPADHSSSDSELTAEDDDDHFTERHHQVIEDHHDESAALGPDVITPWKNHSSGAFRYRTINQKEDLRLLRIQQAPSCQDPIQCTLIHETLHQLLPPFEAISYTWADESGDSLKKATISIDSRVFGVTLNCERALRRVRLRTQSRLVWIDAICINQDSDAEKTHQVQLMAQIYARANRVLIYIGESKQRSSEVLEILDDPRASDQHCRSMIQSQNLEGSLSALLSRPYFWRVWVLQEVALAKDAVLICGGKTVSWGMITRRSKVVGYDVGLCPSHLVSKFNVLQALVAFHPQDNHHITSLPPALGFERPKVRDVRQLLNLLDIASFCDASDPRDKVYALLGLVTGLEPLGFLPDYTETVEDVYLDIAILLAQECGPMAILTRAVCRPSVSRRRPWVPDWRHPPGYIPPEEQLAKINKTVQTTKPTTNTDTESYKRVFQQLDTVLYRQGALRINMSLVCSMAELLFDGGRLGLVGLTHFKITILPADDGNHGPVELDVYPKHQYPKWGSTTGPHISKQTLKWLEGLRIYSPTPTTKSAQTAQMESSRIDVLESQCLVLLEHPSSQSSSSSSGSVNRTTETDHGNGIFKGICTLSLTRSWPPMTDPTTGFWYNKSFVLGCKAAAGDHVLGWHKKEMTPPAFHLKDLEQVVVAKNPSLGISTGT